MPLAVTRCIQKTSAHVARLTACLLAHAAQCDAPRLSWTSWVRINWHAYFGMPVTMRFDALGCLGQPGHAPSCSQTSSPWLSSGCGSARPLLHGALQRSAHGSQAWQATCQPSRPEQGPCIFDRIEICRILGVHVRHSDASIGQCIDGAQGTRVHAHDPGPRMDDDGCAAIA